MRNPMKKCLAAILLAAVLLVPAYLFLRNASLAASRERTIQRNRNRLTGIHQVLDHYYQQREELRSEYIINAYLTGRMRWVTLKTHVEEDRYHGPMTFEDGFVLSMKNGKAVYPEGWNEEILPLPSGIPTLEVHSFTFSAADGRSGFAMYDELTSRDYAFQVVWEEDMKNYQRQYMDDSATLEALESIYGGHLILFDADGDCIINQGSDFFPENPTIESMGLDLQDNTEDVHTWIREGVS